jgi:hypothetical protein
MVSHVSWTSGVSHWRFFFIFCKWFMFKRNAAVPEMNGKSDIYDQPLPGIVRSIDPDWKDAYRTIPENT